MTEEGIYLFLNNLGIDTSKIKKSSNGKWLSLMCPLASHTHHNGEDKVPSFFISISDTTQSIYNCFGCSDKAALLVRLIHNIWLMTGKYPYEAANIYRQYEFSSDREHYENIEYTDIWDSYKIEEVKPLPQKVLSEYPLLSESVGKNADICKKYLVSRGISEAVWTECKVRHKPNENILVFPFTDIFGKIYVLRMRIAYKKKIWTVSHSIAEFSDIIFPTIKNVGVFFGMDLIDFSKPVIIVEAPIDVMRLKTLGCKNVIASGTSMITKAQVHALCADSVMLGFDADLAGKKARKRVLSYIGNDIIVFDLDWSIVMNKNKEPCNDAGDLVCKEDLVKVLKNKKYIDKNFRL